MRPTLARTFLAAAVALAALAAPPRASETDAPVAPSTPGQRIQALVDASKRGPEGLPALRRGLADADPGVRAAAAQLAWEVGGMGEFDRILPLAGDPDSNVAMAALMGMVGRDDPRCVAPVAGALRDAPDTVRAQLAAAIGDRRDARFVEPLGALLSSDKPALRRTALEAMRATGAPEAFPFLMAATSDSDARVVASAVRGLEALGDGRARARLVLLVASEHDAVRSAVARALPAIGEVGASLEPLRALLADEDTSVRMAVMTGVRDHYHPSAVPLLETAAGSDDVRVRRATATALGAASGTDGAAIFDRLLADADPSVRSAAVQGIAERELDSHAGKVAALASDPSVQVRTVVASSLASLDAPDVVAATLGTMSRDAEPSVRAAVAESAATLPEPAGSEILGRLAGDRDPFVRVAVVRGSGRRGDAASLERLRRATEDAEASVRISALLEIGRLGDRGSFEAVRKALGDPVEAVRDAAKTAMPSVRPPS